MVLDIKMGATDEEYAGAVCPDETRGTAEPIDVSALNKLWTISSTSACCAALSTRTGAGIGDVVENDEGGDESVEAAVAVDAVGAYKAGAAA